MTKAKKLIEIIEIKEMPQGPKAKEIIEMDHKYICTTTKCSPVVAKSAKGAVVEDLDGNTYLDFTTGCSVLNIGHCHPTVVKAVQNQAGQLMHFAGTDFYYEIQTRLAKKLTEITPCKKEKKVFFSNSGAESVEAAIKISKWSMKKSQFVGFIGAFHGRTTGANALIGCKPVQRERFHPMMPGVVQIPYAYCYRCRYHQEYPSCDLWCAKILDEVYFQSILSHDEVAAIFIEPIQGEGGYIVPPQGYIKEMKKIAEKHGILFVDDEVQAGFGRTGKMFAIEHFGVAPDIITMAKGMGSGMPIGATVFDARLDFGVSGAHSNTYGGNPVACASSLATIEVIEKDGLLCNAEKLGCYMKKRLKELQTKYDIIGDVRGLGLMQLTEFVENRNTKKPAKKLVEKIVVYAYKHGLLLLPCGEAGIRYIPPLNIPEEQLALGLDILEECIKLSLKT
jgi:4-aminobutyrate aminotransferase